ncbi:MAG: Elongation factor P [Candidatus Falkowbacteria bacterium GW2011_GWC2_38_22]|uniref:Elongation factor P n=1 Tax=Candidatus Falkowbacteria bacterium GW2011_GWE1_38_31 TaxID=1618638 RepID=A0A0G0JU97_9BACT|nr:MAG: Elongation factor P [Candidatus Falkowbacteria bacterium GW2011_GWF2_38_1205]KKQ60988.1 MAG: Elongation factor P [Candidatus Falkowbacteria bacterium GW2011_GWC2_38_22]KKQ63483.1 MAG: Elongation factor P [Candidatus Falkowbacteria bacterium GW2011_GWF1_38_22]KKQ65446.1 MAG: Elongation factor P [Candidatus Falkowbacteria bacterium GW2011_GWE2_38_254]KKQ70247.1 MAG: Elongation factor P [Candidatus Falkowbacteria bacterium GW2011_GWE1_38_31]KKQ72577.1 MAG: Elongation factor P [Candidatus 
MLSLNEIKVGKVIDVNNEPFLVTRTDHHKMGRGGAVLKVKLKNLINGNMLDKTFQGNDKTNEANTEKRKANFMYFDEDNANFMDNESYEQFSISLEAIGEKKKYLKEGTDVDVLYYDNNPVAIDLPIKMSFKVVSAPPGVKGNSAGNVTKQVELETGLLINAPMFINEGDIIKINTDSGEYSERA